MSPQTATQQADLSFKTLGNLRLPLILLVVLIHCHYITYYPETCETAPIFCSIADFLRGNFYAVAVPMFFFISGYLFYRDGIPDTLSLKRKLRSRVHTLLIPYLLWNTIGLLTFLLKASPILVKYFPQYSDVSFTSFNYLEGYLGLHYSPMLVPYDGPLWFIRNLIIILAFTPVMNFILRYCRSYAVIIPIGLHLAFPGFCYGCLGSLIYFILGASIPIANANLSDIINRLKYCPFVFWLIGLVAVKYLVFPERLSDLIGVFNTVCGIFTLISVAFHFTEKGYRTNRLLSRATFFIYAFHGLYITISIHLGVLICPPVNEFAAVITYLIVFLLEAGASFLVYLAANRIMPKTVSLFCGDRS